MSTLPDAVDVVVAGAGTAGAAAALFCAQRGLTTLCLDRGAIDQAGARWVNGVPASMFDRVGLARPTGEELTGAGHPFHLVAGWGPRRVVVPDHEVLDVDMRHLVARLQANAAERGAQFVGGVVVQGVDAQGVNSNCVRTDAGSVRARWVVDASGLNGARLLSGPRPKLGREHLCVAAQAVHAVADRGAMEAFFAKNETPLGHTLCFSGIEGGYSILNVRSEADTVSLLTGSIPALGCASGKVMLDRFVADSPWIGAQVFGGARAIPVRRPFDQLSNGRIAAVGDAVSQVFPAHGSGIAAGIEASKMLADALADNEDPHAYAVRWQRTTGALFAAYDLFRRFSQTIDAHGIEGMMAAGLMDPETSRDTLEQRYPRARLGAVPRTIVGLAKAPLLAARLTDVVARMAVVRAIYSRYPTDASGLASWSRMAARPFGDTPDL